jgi:2-hydroxy-3-keto-5-methylthiopentenyl-1-phosphate phosphatase
MGAYSNPETYIDTQSAQAYQRLQDTISGTFANVAQSYATRQKEIRTQLEENAKQIKANEMKAQEYEFSLYTDLAKSTASDPSVDWAKTYEPLINQAVQIRSGMLNGTLTDKQGAMKRLGQIQGSVDNVVQSIATMSGASETFMKDMAKGVAVQGGIASSNSPKFLNAMNVLLQKVPGRKEVYFKDNDPTKLMWKVSDINGNVLQEFDADQLKKISQGNGIIRTIPNQIAEFDKLKSTNSSIFETVPPKPGEKGDPMPTGQINPEFLVKKDGKPKVIVNKIKTPDGTDVTTYTQEVDINAIRSNDNFQTTLTAQANGLLDSNQSAAIDFYNDIMSNPQGRWKGTGLSFDPNKPLDEAGKKKFIEDYKEYYINTQIVPTQPLLRPDPNQVAFVEKAEKPEKPKAEKEGKEDKKESIQSVSKRIWDTKKGKVADFTYNGRKVAYDGDVFMVERTAGLKDLVFKTKQDVINYLKTGSAQKPNP